MSSPFPPGSFSRAGAMDLSSLVQRSTSAGAAGAPVARGRYVLDVTEASFDTVMRQSVNHVIVVEFHSPRAEGGEQLSQLLANLADHAEGRWLLARVNVDEEMRIAQALGVQAVPMVVGVLAGQLAPLFQGVIPPEQVQAYLDELVHAAVANGITGRAEPVGEPEADADDSDDDEARDPRFEAADAAVDAGDYATALAEYEKLVQANPHDAEAVAGRAMVGLLVRVTGLDAETVLAQAANEPTNLEAQLQAADVEMISGDPGAAMGRLIQQIRVRAGDERNTVRLRLLDLFETQAPDDPTVLKARRDLMAALF